MFAIARAVLLLRCLFSSQAREEFRVYRANTSRWRMIANAYSALVGLIFLGTLLVVTCYTVLVFYHLATTGEAVP